MSEIKKCVLCGESAYSVKISKHQYFIKPVRWSKCRFYKKHKMSTCKTEVYDSESEAVDEWNYRQKVYSNAIARKSF